MQRLFNKMRNKIKESKKSHQQAVSPTNFLMRALYQVSVKEVGRFQMETTLRNYQSFTSDEICENFRAIVFQCTALKTDEADLLAHPIEVAVSGKINELIIEEKTLHTLRELHAFLNDQAIPVKFPSEEEIVKARADHDKAVAEQLHHPHLPVMRY